ncbi:hypothetical protein N825_25265 [Skermanella stibiiresistens SB22]|uniref:HTH cro/C1-type domain-containing protein n=1 Tax=Skermanella stibiiresistens SB22 TaxID=1385369 RepID=W9GVU0_9PROT|nr:helix-turn-helix domain-containing protein [Skermanella stibiiresistens]EWY36746.1 hypothetical protein N825_25265 [Skermanella stibiiresistens SB22]
MDTNLPVDTLSPSTLGLEVARRRGMAGWSQRELAQQSGVAQSKISLLESGKSQTAEVSTVQDLAKAFGCHLTELLGDTAPPAPAIATSDEDAGDRVTRHITKLFPSPLNPRKRFDPAAVAEIADSIAAKGLLQPLTIRAGTRDILDAVGQLAEVYIGGTRYRALKLLHDEGRWPEDRLPGGMVPCTLRECSDIELIEIALTENIQRQDMHPLEEGQAFLDLERAGKADPAEIARVIAKTPRFVQLRMQMARDLAPAAAEAFAAGRISTEMARELVRVPHDVQLSHLGPLLKADWGYKTASELHEKIHAGFPNLGHALFDKALYTGDLAEDHNTYGGKTLKCCDVTLFRQLQDAAVEAKAVELRETHAFVEIVRSKTTWLDLDPAKLSKTYARDERGGAAIVIMPDYRVQIVEPVRRWSGDTKPAEMSTAEKKALAKKTDPVAGVSTGRRIYAKAAKSRALQRATLETGTATVLRVAIMGLLGDDVVAIRPEAKGPDNHALDAGLALRLGEWRDRLGAGLVDLDPYLKARSRGDTKLWAALRELDRPALEDLHACLVVQRLGVWSDPWRDDNLGDTPLQIALASAVDLDMAEVWTVDAAYVATLDKAQLLDLADSVGLIFGDRHEWAKAKVSELRQAIVAIAQSANAFRHLPPELAFASAKTIQQRFRSGTAAPANPATARGGQTI